MSSFQMSSSGRYGGYRTMCQLLQTRHDLRVSRATVRLIVSQIDPVSVNRRRQHRLRRRTYACRGPNDVWHIDGYDKLRPYGILISGYVCYQFKIRPMAPTEPAFASLGTCMTASTELCARTKRVYNKPYSSVFAADVTCHA
jgi:hypothetical protein